MAEIYLSRLVLNQRSRDARRDLWDCSAMHERIAGLVGPTPPYPQPRALYRLDGATILLQTPEVPDWSLLPDGYLFQPDDAFGFGLASVQTHRIDQALSTLGAGRVFRFRLRLWAEDGKFLHQYVPATRGSRSPVVVTEVEAIAWLLRREAARGFQVYGVGGLPDLSVTKEQIPGGHPKRKQPHAVFLCEGRLRVTDPAALWQTLTRGIGEGRAYGCGLLSLAPA
jgi:CRISPR system Cascade subunit CasE